MFKIVKLCLILIGFTKIVYSDEIDFKVFNQTFCDTYKSQVNWNKVTECKNFNYETINPIFSNFKYWDPSNKYQYYSTGDIIFKDCSLKKIPENIMNVTIPESLVIENCNLEDSFIQLMGTRSLYTKELIIIRNKIRNLPEFLLKQFPEIRHISFAENELTTIKRNYFREYTDEDLKYNVALTELEQLNLMGNKINFIEKNSFEQLTSIRVINLSSNQFKIIAENPLNTPGIFDFNIFSKKCSCKNLDISNNPIEKISSINNEFCAYLQLNLSSINIPPNSLDFNTFFIVKNAEHLDISNNNLKSINKYAFYHLNSLRTIYLDGNQLTELDYNDPKFIRRNYKLGLTSNNWNCTYLEKLITELNYKDVEYLIPKNHIPKGDANIAGIGCYNRN